MVEAGVWRFILPCSGSRLKVAPTTGKGESGLENPSYILKEVGNVYDEICHIGSGRF
jgi:hypothetical protein